MQVKNRTSNDDERLILTGMIVDDLICGRICARWEREMFRSRYANIIARWCARYFKRHNKAPRKHIKNEFDKFARTSTEKQTIELLEIFLEYMSTEYSKSDFNTDYVLDVAGEYFNAVRLERLANDIENDIAEDKVKDAEQRVIGYHPVNIGVGETHDVLQSTELLNDVFEKLDENIIDFGDTAIGSFYRYQLARDCFVSFMGPEKRGKSFFLMDMAFRAALQRRRVAFFEAGDMSRRQWLRRAFARCAERPFFPGEAIIPTSLVIKHVAGSRKAIVKHRTKTYKKYVRRTDVHKGRQDLLAMMKAQDSEYFRISFYPNTTLRVDMIESTLHEWAIDNWVADVIIIDYADILDMTERDLQRRDQIDKTWRKLRRLAQTLHCLVITATQSDAASYDAYTIGMGHFSEDKRKLAHVTGMIGLNATEYESREQVVRLNWVAKREGESAKRKTVYVAGCRAIASPMIKSAFSSPK